MGAGAIGAGLGSLVGGILGGNAAQGEYDASMGITREQYEQLKNLQVPDVDKMKIYLEGLQSQGTLTPFQETATNLGDSSYAAITTDPRLRAQQMSALEEMSGISQTGMTDIDRAAMQEMLRQAQAQETANRKTILEGRAARGMAGSGDELAAALASSQSSSNQSQSNAMKLAAQAMQNRLGALSQSSDMAKSIESSDYNRASQLANQRDAISRFNAELAAQTQQRNISRQNEAQQLNLREAQRLADANVGQRNQQQMYNKELLQKEYDNKLRKLQGQGAAASNLSSAHQARGNAIAGQYQQIGSGIGGLIGEVFGKTGEDSSGGTQDSVGNRGDRAKRINSF